jgi:3-ketoacyl-CoA synthase
MYQLAHATCFILSCTYVLTGCHYVRAGGAKVLDGIGKELQLDEAAMEPSRMVLHDYGNVSSSTTWYTLGYVESVRGAKKGE